VGHDTDQADEPAGRREAVRWIRGLSGEVGADGRGVESVEGLRADLDAVCANGDGAAVEFGVVVWIVWV